MFSISISISLVGILSPSMPSLGKKNKMTYKLEQQSRGLMGWLHVTVMD